MGDMCPSWAVAVGTGTHGAGGRGKLLTYCTQCRPSVAHEQQIEALHVFPPSPSPLHRRLAVHQGAVEQVPGGRAGQACLEQLHLSLKGIGHRC